VCVRRLQDLPSYARDLVKHLTDTRHLADDGSPALSA
jgi:hypothetical protein